MSLGDRLSVLVTDGEHNAALAVVRSLGRSGYDVHVCSTRRRSIAGSSRHAASHTAVADPLREPAKFVGDVRALLQHRSIDILLPVSDASLLAVLSERASLGDVLIPFPGLAAFQRASDKQLVTRLAAELGLHVPAQHTIEQATDRAVDWGELRYPLVVKPARSVTGSGERRKTHVVHVSNADSLKTTLAALHPESYPVLLQERIVGPGLGVFLLLWDGELRASFCHRRIREKPPSGGVSVMCESVAPDHGLIAAAEALLRACQWNGVAMVEFKLDAATMTPYLMEINGRFWGSLQLAVDAGVDFPVLLVESALGKPRRSAGGYEVGLVSRWFWGDVDHLMLRLRRSAQKLSLAPDAPNRSRAVRDFLRGFGGRHRDAVFRADDPAPALRETLDWFHRR